MSPFVRWGAAVVVLGVLGAIFGSSLPVHFQWDLYDALRQTSSIILGVAGVWIGLVYPDVLSGLVRGTADRSNLEVRNLQRLLLLVAVSVLIICCALLYGFLWGILRSADLPPDATPWLRRCSFAVLGALTAVQVIAAIASLAPAEVFRGNLRVLSGRNEMLARLRRAQGQDDPE